MTVPVSPEQLLEVIRTRRSVRRFLPRALPPEAISHLVEAFRWAPTGGNAQPWRLVIVRSEAVRAKLGEAAQSQSFVAQAPVVIVVCVDRDRARKAYGNRGEALYCLQDTAAAIENLLLMAHAMGLGACWVGAFRETSVSEVLGLPSHLRPIAIVPVGWPDGTPPAPRRRTAPEFVEER